MSEPYYYVDPDELAENIAYAESKLRGRPVTASGPRRIEAARPGTSDTAALDAEDFALDRMTPPDKRSARWRDEHRRRDDLVAEQRLREQLEAERQQVAASREVRDEVYAALFDYPNSPGRRAQPVAASAGEDEDEWDDLDDEIDRLTGP